MTFPRELYVKPNMINIYIPSICHLLSLLEQPTLTRLFRKQPLPIWAIATVDVNEVGDDVAKCNLSVLYVRWISPIKWCTPQYTLRAFTWPSNRLSGLLIVLEQNVDDIKDPFGGPSSLAKLWHFDYVVAARQANLPAGCCFPLFSLFIQPTSSSTHFFNHTPSLSSQVCFTSRCITYSTAQLARAQAHAKPLPPKPPPIHP